VAHHRCATEAQIGAPQIRVFLIVFQIVHTDAVSQALRDFLGDENIGFCGVATNNNMKMLSYYGIVIPGDHDLHEGNMP
jgi:hypothetical protein